MATTVIKVIGMHCNHCTSSVEQGLGQIPGVTSVVANLESGDVTVEQDGTVEVATLAEAIDEIGFEVA